MFDQDPNEQANISGADFAILVDELESLRARVQELEAQREAYEAELFSVKHDCDVLEDELISTRNSLDVVDVLCNELTAKLAAAEERVKELEIGHEWKPIASAPKDNKRRLLLARFNDDGSIQSFDWNGGWESESESWETPHVYHYWASENGNVEEPSHWMYEPDWLMHIDAAIERSE